MSKVKRFSLEERYGYQNRKVIYDKDTDDDIELNNIYPIIGLLNQFDKQIADLEAKLAEKDKEISNLNGLVRERDKQIKNLKTNKKRVIEHKNKTKISFALEQLEKVKENIKKVPITDFDLSGNFEKMYKQDAIRQIDNQIKSLKGEE